MEPEDVPEGPVALDTNVFSLIHTRKGRHEDFAKLIMGRVLALPFAVVGELRAGAIIGNWQERRLAALEERIARCVVIPFDDRVVEQWAAMYARFRGQLQITGINDLWIAACCLVYNLSLVTENLNDFTHIQAEFSKLVIVHPDLPS